MSEDDGRCGEEWILLTNMPVWLIITDKSGTHKEVIDERF